MSCLTASTDAGFVGALRQRLAVDVGDGRLVNCGKRFGEAGGVDAGTLAFGTELSSTVGKWSP